MAQQMNGRVPLINVRIGALQKSKLYMYLLMHMKYYASYYLFVHVIFTTEFNQFCTMNSLVIYSIICNSIKLN